jgi:hypothetical protein
MRAITSRINANTYAASFWNIRGSNNHFNSRHFHICGSQSCAIGQILLENPDRSFIPSFVTRRVILDYL